MKSINFEFLRPKWPELAGLGGFAETYAHLDPALHPIKLLDLLQNHIAKDLKELEAMLG